MRNVLLKSLLPGIVAILFGGTICGQTLEKLARNNPYAPSPASKQKAMETAAKPKSVLIDQVASINALPFNQAVIPHVVEAKAELPPNRKPSPTGHYSVGIGDVLAVEIRNGVTSTTICSVRADGSVDFPLAGATVIVLGQSVEEISATLIKAVRLYEKPQISVSIRESASHTVLVTGLVAVPGTHYLQRDAVPLFVIRAAAAVDPKAQNVNIRRAADSTHKSHILSGSFVDDILVYPGDEIEFTGGADASTTGYYYIGGEIASGGKKYLSAGLRLKNAVAASGGVKGKARKVRIRRHADDGSLITEEHDLESISAGKTADPALIQGDIVEISK